MSIDNLAPGGTISPLYHYAPGDTNVLLILLGPGGNNFPNIHFSPMYKVAHQKEDIFQDSLANLLNKGAIIAKLVGVI